jgi:hypothetical protein
MKKSSCKVMLFVLFSACLVFHGIIATSNTTVSENLETSVTLEAAGKATLCSGDWALITSTLTEPKNVTWYVKSSKPAVGMTVLFMTWAEYLKFENENPYTVTSVLADGSQYTATGTFLEQNTTTWAFVFMHNDSDPEAINLCPRVTYSISFEKAEVPGFEFAGLLLGLVFALVALQFAGKKVERCLKL